MSKNIGKQILAIILAVMSLSSALTVFAEADTQAADPSIYRLENQKNTEERGFIIKDGAIYDLSGKFLSNISADGQLDNGQFLSEDFTVHYGKSPWAIDDINNAIDAGIVPVLLRYGYEENINREDFAVIAYNLLVQSGKLQEETVSAKFTDTNSNEINALANIGIITGRTDNQFAPDENILREEAAAILARIADYADIKSDSTYVPDYDDNDKISSWAKENIYSLKRLGIMHGEAVYDENGKEEQYINLFNPRSEITKEESIVAFMRIYDMIK